MADGSYGMRPDLPPPAPIPEAREWPPNCDEPETDDAATDGAILGGRGDTLALAEGERLDALLAMLISRASDCDATARVASVVS